MRHLVRSLCPLPAIPQHRPAFCLGPHVCSSLGLRFPIRLRLTPLACLVWEAEQETIRGMLGPKCPWRRDWPRCSGAPPATGTRPSTPQQPGVVRGQDCQVRGSPSSGRSSTLTFYLLLQAEAAGSALISRGRHQAAVPGGGAVGPCLGPSLGPPPHPLGGSQVAPSQQAHPSYRESHRASPSTRGQSCHGEAWMARAGAAARAGEGQGSAGRP